MSTLIRQETPADYNIVYELITSAFKNTTHSDEDEANLVGRLRESKSFVPELSLVAEVEGEIVGHILFSANEIVNENQRIKTLALAPVSVLPEYQNQGIGRQLINKGHDIARNIGFQSVIVLGHPQYYPRFGYKPASLFGITCPFEVPDDTFMALELSPKALKGVHGMMVYAEAFEG